MELWLEELKNKINYDIWLFGHFHADRIERPKSEICYTDIEEIDNTYNRWNTKDELEKVDYQYDKGPNYYIEES